ncbi:MAG: polymer-forming cytoskeletal protein [Phycisphaerales bacterium]|nr:polymer-forming cytoskeletal protein [Phycisphaerales bacterium]
MAETHNEFPTVLGEDAVFKGELRFEKGMKLLGKFEGQITSDGQMVVAEGAVLTGDAKAGTIKIEGQVKGNIHAATKIQLSASARLEGDLQTQRLEVAEGAVLIGRCVVGVNGPSKGGDQKIVTRPVETIAPQKSKAPETMPAPAMARK